VQAFIFVPNFSVSALTELGIFMTIVAIAFIGSRPNDHYFRSVCLFVCAEFFSAVFDPISIKLGHMLFVWV